MSMLEQVDFEAAQQVGSPFRRAGQVYVIEECPNAFARQGVGLEGTQGRGEAKGKQCRHERIPLFASLGLENAVWYASIIDPHFFFSHLFPLACTSLLFAKKRMRPAAHLGGRRLAGTGCSQRLSARSS